MSNAVSKAFSTTMKSLRKKKSFSQENVAEISGLHVNTVHLLEKGKSEPKLSTFIYIAKALEVSPEQLMDDFIKRLFNS